MSDERLSARDESARRISESLRRHLGSFCTHLSDPRVIELMLNPDGMVWVERLGEPMAAVGFMAASAAESFMGTIASTLRTTITRENPVLECELPLDGSRFEALIPPVVTSPVFAIRRRASAVFSLQDYERQGIMTPAQRTIVERAVRERRNVLVVGGTGTGKTTLTNAIIAEIVVASPDHRLVIIEDTAEIQCAAKNAVLLRATEHVSMRRLLKATMRLRPDRIIVGEVRGGEALDLLKAWNTGHPGGVCTVHANNARAGLTRVEQLIAEVSTQSMHALIAEAVDVIVCIARAGNRAGRRVTEVVTVEASSGGDYRLSSLES